MIRKPRRKGLSHISELTSQVLEDYGLKATPIIDTQEYINEYIRALFITDSKLSEKLNDLMEIHYKGMEVPESNKRQWIGAPQKTLIVDLLRELFKLSPKSVQDFHAWMRSNLKKKKDRKWRLLIECLEPLIEEFPILL